MTTRTPWEAGRTRGTWGETPLAVVGWGLLAGVAATALLSVLGRLTRVLLVTAGARSGRDGEGPDRAPGPGIRAHPGVGDPGDAPPDGPVVVPVVGPAAVLAQAQGPGPEEAAAQFARKLLAGLFGRDISPYTGVAGEVVHFTYGGLWGVLYGLVQSTYGAPTAPFGLLFGLLVWLVGPGCLVPAMRLMAPPWREPALRLTIMVAGHLVYGLAVAGAYRHLAAGRGRSRCRGRAG